VDQYAIVIELQAAGPLAQGLVVSPQHQPLHMQVD
jgi:hypothetical protein